MKLQHPFAMVAALAAMVFSLSGVCAQDEKAKPKTVPAAKVVPAAPQEKEEAKADEGPSLDIGSKAPEIAISEWVKGQKIDGFKPGQLYVVEFWATWCGPCLMSMPHLAELQTKYGDKVKMIGVSDEETEIVTKFLKEDQSKDKTWDEVITYALAMDDERKTTEAYRTAAMEGGIPTAFIIGKDGHIEWIGHPMAMDKPLEEIVSGSFDRVAAKTERKEAKALEIVMMKASNAIRSGNSETAVKLIDQLLEKQPDTIQFQFMKFQALSVGKDKDATAKFADSFVSKIDKMIEASPSAAQLQFLKLEVLSKTSDQAAAVKFTNEFMEKSWEDAMALNQIAWGIAADKNVAGDLEIALKAAKRGVELTKEEDGLILDTLARVYFELGKFDDAIETQKKAVKFSDRPDIKAALEKYEKAKEESTKKAA